MSLGVDMGTKCEVSTTEDPPASGSPADSRRARLEECDGLCALLLPLRRMARVSVHHSLQFSVNGLTLRTLRLNLSTRVFGLLNLDELLFLPLDV